MSCKKIRVQPRGLCLGDLRHRITLENRSITEPDAIDFGEEFDKPIIVNAAVKTLMGVDVFDDNNVLVSASHDFYIRFKEGLTSEIWINWKGKRYDVLLIENIDEVDDWMRLRSKLTGPNTRPVNVA